jgi:hypothetical protein
MTPHIGAVSGPNGAAGVQFEYQNDGVMYA